MQIRQRDTSDLCVGLSCNTSDKSWNIWGFVSNVTSGPWNQPALCDAIFTPTVGRWRAWYERCGARKHVDCAEVLFASKMSSRMKVATMSYTIPPSPQCSLTAAQSPWGKCAIHPLPHTDGSNRLGLLWGDSKADPESMANYTVLVPGSR